jgi:hypothetical protein
MKHTPGNGSGKFNVHTEDMGGWLRVFTDPLASVPADLPFYLSHTLTEWFRQHPQARLRTVTAISRDGDTVELHAWYELHILPDISGKQANPTSPRS